MLDMLKLVRVLNNVLAWYVKYMIRETALPLGLTLSLSIHHEYSLKINKRKQTKQDKHMPNFLSNAEEWEWMLISK